VEELGLIVPFTRYVIAHVADELPKSAQLPKDFKISINVGSEHLNNEQLFADMLKFKHALPANLQLVVELTERTPIDIDEHAEQLQQLQRHAIKIALDDFGSGHSSLSYLKKLHPDYIKIDKTFTATIGTEAITATVLNMIIDLGQKLNIAVVAEGVETEEQANYLLQRGVQFLQGFYFARPISMAELQQWLNSKIIYPPAHVPRIMPIAKTADSAHVRHKKAD
ncbi:MAG: EAL domain-containing protein, partial [Plesiomonas shigelloides]